MASNIKVDIVRPTATNGSLSLKGDSGGSATANGISVDSSGNTSVSGQLNADNIRLDGNTISSTNTDGGITLDPNGTGIVSLDGAVTINESGADADFRVESDTNTHALFVEGSSGNLLVGMTSPINAFNLANIQASNSKNGLGISTSSGSGTSFFAAFYAGTSLIGSISTTNNTTTAYNTASDYRLKEDWQPMSGSIDRLKNLNPVNFAWKVDGSRVDGFLAHEAAEVVPEAITGEKDAVEAIGNITDVEGNVVRENVREPEELAEGQVWTKTEDRPVYQGIDQSKLVPLLTAALQEAVAKIEALESRIAALEANV